jgi:hypothetical protein
LALAMQLDLFNPNPALGNQKTMANANLSSILDRPATEFNAPPPMPTGGYHCVVMGLPEAIVSSIKKTDGFRFLLKPIAPDEDVDAQELEAIGGLEGKVIRNDMWVTENSAFMMREFLEHCGIDSEGKSLGAMIDECPNSEVMVYIKHTPLQGREGFRAEVAKTAPIEA